MQKMANEGNLELNSIDKLVEQQLNARQAAGAPQQPERSSAQPRQRLEEAISDYDGISRAAAEKLNAIDGNTKLTGEQLKEELAKLGIDWRDYSICPVDYVKSGELEGTHYTGPAGKEHFNPRAIPPRLLTKLVDMQLCQEHRTKLVAPSVARQPIGAKAESGMGTAQPKYHLVGAAVNYLEEINTVIRGSAPYEVVSDELGFAKFVFTREVTEDRDTIIKARENITRLETFFTAIYATVKPEEKPQILQHLRERYGANRQGA